MDLDALRAYLAVIDSGSFLSAADQLGLARATLRRRVDELEARTGVALVHRSRTGATATEAGRVLAARGRLIVQEANALLSSVREVGDEPAGTLRLVLPVGLPPHLAMPVIAGLRSKYQRLRMRIRFADDPMSGLLEDVDVAVHFGSLSPDGPWVSHELVRIREWLIASPEYLERRGTPATTDELRDHDLLAWHSPDGDPELWPTLEATAIRVEPILVSSDIHMLRQCAAAGLGIAFLPDARLPAASASEQELIPVLPDVVGRERALRVVVPAALAEIPRIRAVLEEVRSFLDRQTQPGTTKSAQPRRRR